MFKQFLKNKNMHEQLSTTDSTTEAFLNAEGHLYDIVEEDVFSETCLRQGLDPLASVTDARYWEIVEDMVNDKVKEGEANGESDLDLAALQITAYAPLFLQAEHLLNSHAAMSSQERQGLRQRTSFYNDLIRFVGGNYPDAQASSISGAMLGAAEIAGMSSPETSNQVRATIRGAQHELAFRQLLTERGKKFRDSTQEEDLHGIDFVVNVNGKDLMVDVKASLSEVEALGGSNGPFAMKWATNRHQPNKTVIYSMVKDSELGDNFHIDEDLAAERAQKLEYFLVQASQLSQAS
jgi:hypothetical protein